MLKQKIAGLLAGFTYKIYSSTFRYHFIFEDESDKKIFYDNLAVRGTFDKNIIYSCFHQDDITLLSYFNNLDFCILISNSKDGEILASAVEYLGFKTVRGSSHRGGVAGLLAGMKKMKEGYRMVLAVDGPRGPIYKVKDGITALAEKFEKPIVPVRGFPYRKYVFERSWNKATLPMPFTRIEVVIGKIKNYTTIELEEKLLSLSKLSSY